MQSMMYGQDVGEMRDREDARIWEEINQDDPRFKRYPEAVTEMRKAEVLLHEAMTHLENAENATKDTPLEYRIADYYDATDELAERFGMTALQIEEVI